jgi:hypothetical protein
VRVGRGKIAFHPDAFIHHLGESDKLGPVHLLAGVFPQAALEPGLLGRTAGHRKHHFIGLFLNLIIHQNAPQIEAEGLDKAGQAWFLNPEAGAQVFGGHAGHTAPDLFVELFGRRLVEAAAT